MQNPTPSFPSIGAALGNPSSSFQLSDGEVSEGGFEISRVFFLVPFLLFQGGVGGGGGGGEEGLGLAMDLSKVGEKILSSVRSARSLGLLPSVAATSAAADDRPEVPARAAAAAAVARVLAALPAHQQFSLPSGSEELRSIYGSRPQGQVVEELEENFYEEDFDPIRHILEHIPEEDNDLDYLEKQATLRLAQLDVVSERLSRQVMEHHEVMVKGMNLVRELEKDLKIANIICMNGRRHLSSSMNEVSRDLIVNSHAKKKQALLDVLPVLIELRRALDMQEALESLVEDGNFCKAFQVLSEYLQLLDSLSELSAMQEMSRGVEVWLGTTLQRLDALLLGVCQDFKEDNYLTVVDAYALIGDVPGLAEKIQSFFMQEVLSETHSVLKTIVQGDQEAERLNTRLTYSDLCFQIPESKFRQCLLKTLAILFRLMCSYYEIMSFELHDKDSAYDSSHGEPREVEQSLHAGELQQIDLVSSTNNHSEEVDHPLIHREGPDSSSLAEATRNNNFLTNHSTTMGSVYTIPHHQDNENRTDDTGESSSDCPWYLLRKDATAFVSQTLERGRKNLWQLTTSRVSVLLSAAAVGSASVHQFLKNHEDLNAFILAGEAFCGFEAVEFRNKLKVVCENYFASLHRQHVHALKMVLEKETWAILPLDTMGVVSFPGLIGDGAPLIAPSNMNSVNVGFQHSDKLLSLADSKSHRIGFTSWLKGGNPFLSKVVSTAKEGHNSLLNGASTGDYDGESAIGSGDKMSPSYSDVNHRNGNAASEDEDEDLLADFIDEDSQLPSRSSKVKFLRSSFSVLKCQDTSYHTGSSLCLLRSMDKYGRLMQKLELMNVEFFKGICQLFEVLFYHVYEIFVHSSGRGLSNPINYKLKAALSRIMQDCDQWIKPQMTTLSSSSPTSLSAYMHADVTPTSPPLVTSSSLKERCAAASTISFVAQILKRSKSHLQSMLLQKNPAMVEDFYTHLVDTIPDLTAQIHRTTARLILQIQGFADKIANAKWEVKELGLEHNGYVDLLLGEFKHYTSRLANGGIDKEMLDHLLEHGLEVVAEILIEGLSRVKRCTDEGRALMSLDMQVLINGLKHFVSVDVKSKFLIVETFIKAYYLPETEYIHWARAHPEYSKSQIVGLINLVATMKGWKRKTRLEILEKLE